MSLTMSVAPPEEPVSLTEAKAHCRIDHNDSDTELAVMMQSAREYIEGKTGIDLVLRTWVYTMESFPASGGIDLPKSPVISITSIQYVDTAGDTQTLDSSAYVLDSGKVYLAYGESWPSVRSQRAAITITFVSGYPDDVGDYAANIPQPMKSAILLLICDLYEMRQDHVPYNYTHTKTVEMLIRPFGRHPTV